MLSLPPAKLAPGRSVVTITLAGTPGVNTVKLKVTTRPAAPSDLASATCVVRPHDYCAVFKRGEENDIDWEDGGLEHKPDRGGKATRGAGWSFVARHNDSFWDKICGANPGVPGSDYEVEINNVKDVKPGTQYVVRYLPRFTSTLAEEGYPPATPAFTFAAPVVSRSNDSGGGGGGGSGPSDKQRRRTIARKLYGVIKMVASDYQADYKVKIVSFGEDLRVYRLKKGTPGTARSAGLWDVKDRDGKDHRGAWSSPDYNVKIVKYGEDITIKYVSGFCSAGVQ